MSSSRLETSDVVHWMECQVDALILHPVTVSKVLSFQHLHYPVTEWLSQLDRGHITTRLNHWHERMVSRSFDSMWMSGNRTPGHIMLASPVNEGNLRWDYCNIAHLCVLRADRTIDMTALAIACQRLMFHCMTVDPCGETMRIVIPDTRQWTTQPYTTYDHAAVRRMVENIVRYEVTYDVDIS